MIFFPPGTAAYDLMRYCLVFFDPYSVVVIFFPKLFVFCLYSSSPPFPPPFFSLLLLLSLSLLPRLFRFCCNFHLLYGWFYISSSIHHLISSTRSHFPLRCLSPPPRPPVLPPSPSGKCRFKWFEIPKTKANVLSRVFIVFFPPNMIEKLMCISCKQFNQCLSVILAIVQTLVSWII